MKVANISLHAVVGWGKGTWMTMTYLEDFLHLVAIQVLQRINLAWSCAIGRRHHWRRLGRSHGARIFFWLTQFISKDTPLSSG